MNPIAMLSIIVAALAAFAWSAARRWQLLTVGTSVDRFDHIPERVGRVLRYGIKQEKMHKYRGAGLAHQMIFAGFVVLLLRSLILWSRGFDAGAGFFLFNPGQKTFGLPLGDGYGLIKDIFALGVIAGAAYFFYLRTVVKPQRMNLSGEGLLIICIILTMMFADILYDGAVIALDQQYRWSPMQNELRESVDKVIAHRKLLPMEGHVHFDPMEPAGSAASLAVAWMSPKWLVFLAHAGFWTHSALVLIFLNILPHSKHFHIITGIPNIFFTNLEARGKLPYIGGSEAILERIGTASEQADPYETDGLGKARIEQFSWKAILDFYTCTECGRCSDNCPAHLTGKLLSPKHLTLDLRNHLYGREKEFIDRLDAEEPKGGRAQTADEAEKGVDATKVNEGEGATEGTDAQTEAPRTWDLVNPGDPAMGVIHPDVIWACTSCRACEEQCPVLISYVDKITEMRRNVVMVRGEFPHELQRPFQGMETNGNPWNLSRLDRDAWTSGLEVKTLADNPGAEVLYWVGCAASYDDRAKKIARATAKLLKAAGVDFAILGQEETCTGDPARRAGNEYLFATLAETNVATLNGYEVAKKTIITTCPHCFNTLANEYPDFGGKFNVVHHTEYLLGLLEDKKLTPKKNVAEKLVYHDSCYLGRYNDIYDAPREILKAIGANLQEAEWSRSKGLCCGAGGAQMFMEEKGTERVNKKRTLQLLDTGAKTIASACPFCMTMLTDGLKAENLEDKVKQMDVAELLAVACALGDSSTSTVPDEPKSEEETATA
jgi:Fe-S oxidoreductase